jgi:N-acetylmuramoyl-L-alanine amidase
MFKTAFLIQTILLSFLTTSSPDFNVSLSFLSHLPLQLTTNNGAFESNLFVAGHKANDLGLNNLPQESRKPQTAFSTFSFSEQLLQSPEVKTVVIDPGHGGHDPGCLGKKSHEKNIALAIAKKLANAIKTTHPDVKVILTRESDVFIPLHKRAAIANRNNADLFISIHCNSMPKGHSSTHGTETYVMGLHTATHNLNVAKRENASILLEADYEKTYDYDPNSPEGHIMLSMFQNAYLDQSIQFARKVEQQFKSVTNRKSRGVKQAGFVVLKETTMPSVLIETGFLSNNQEENYLFTSKGQNSVAKAILIAFNNYKKEVESASPGLVEYDFVDVVPNKKVAPQNKQNEVYYTINESPSYNYNPPAQQKKSAPATRPALKRPSKEFYQPVEQNEGYRTYPGINHNDRSVPTYERSTTYTEKSVASTRNIPAPKKVKPRPTLTNGPIRFRVQLAASPSPMDTSNPQWKRTGYMIEIIHENNLYKYQALNFGNYHHALEAKMNLRAQGFSDAFIVAYQKGRRIPLMDAKKLLGLE